MKKQETINVVIYARYSSHNQTEQSIEGQLKTCYEYVERNGYTVVKEYIDRAISGKTDNRPEFQKMIEDSTRKRYKYIIVYQLDRFARNRYDSAIYKAKLKKNGVRVLSARENITDDASGILIESLLEGMAEYASVELGQKIKRGMDLNADKCLSTGGNVALGFYVDATKHFQIDNETAPIVVKIFEMYANGDKMADIQHYLNSQQIKTSRGNQYNKNSIARILKNKRYKGVYTYNGTETKDGIPRIVTDELFEQVQIIMGKNRRAPARAKAKVDYILSTKLACGNCGSTITGVTGTSKNKNSYHYYQCSGKRRKEGCRKRNVNKEHIENRVISETKKLLTNKKIDEIAKQVIALCEKERDTSNLRRLEKLLKENENANENLMKALELGQVTEEIIERISKKKEERGELERQITKEKMEQPSLSLLEVKFFLSKFKNGNINDIKYRKSLADTFVRKIYLYDDKMTILYNVKDSQSVVHFGDVCSPKDCLVENGN